MTHIFPTHGFKHLLQLNSQLLNVVDQDAGLRTEICQFETTCAHYNIFKWISPFVGKGFKQTVLITTMYILSRPLTTFSIVT